MYGDAATVRTILTELGDTWAVVGLFSNQQRAASRSSSSSALPPGSRPPLSPG